jgi:hypothetical protein
MSADPYCPHRWDPADPTDPGYCQCRLWVGHPGPHRCCCGNEADDE